MNIPRQSERRVRFLAALADMPRFETWTTYSDENGHLCHENEPQMVKKREHVKLIPRCVRRDMARQRSRREYRHVHNLPAPR